MMLLPPPLLCDDIRQPLFHAFHFQLKLRFCRVFFRLCFELNFEWNQEKATLELHINQIQKFTISQNYLSDCSKRLWWCSAAQRSLGKNGWRSTTSETRAKQRKEKQQLQQKSHKSFSKVRCVHVFNSLVSFLAGVVVVFLLSCWKLLLLP